MSFDSPVRSQATAGKSYKVLIEFPGTLNPGSLKRYNFRVYNVLFSCEQNHATENLSNAGKKSKTAFLCKTLGISSSLRIESL